MQALSLNANCELVCFILCIVSSAQGKVCLEDKETGTQESKTQWDPQRPNPGKQSGVEKGSLWHSGNVFVVVSE